MVFLGDGDFNGVASEIEIDVDSPASKSHVRRDVDVVDPHIADEGTIFTPEIDEAITILIELNFGMMPGYGCLGDAQIAFRMRTDKDESFLKILGKWRFGMSRQAVFSDFKGGRCIQKNGLGLIRHIPTSLHLRNINHAHH